MAKYDRIGLAYNETRKADPYLTSALFRLLNPSKTGIYLDVGCGTGNYTSALAEKGVHLIGLDPSSTMLEKAQKQHRGMQWHIGKAESIPFDDNSMDGVLATLTLHHWDDITAGFKEIYRVLKPGGRFLFFTATPHQMEGYWLNHYFPQMLQKSIQQMSSKAAIQKMLKEALLGLVLTEKYFIQPDLQDGILYVGKHQPERYFEEGLRGGISSFSDLANRSEVANGLLQLREDIDNQSIQGIVKSYENTEGDYLFVLAEKPNLTSH